MDLEVSWKWSSPEDSFKKLSFKEDERKAVVAGGK